jgi:hypothetical protein
LQYFYSHSKITLSRIKEKPVSLKKAQLGNKAYESNNLPTVDSLKIFIVKNYFFVSSIQ